MKISVVIIIIFSFRLDTILGYDRILVLDQGRVKEFDAPSKLLQDENSTFYDMVRRSDN